MSTGHNARRHAWRRIQTEIEMCRECCVRWPNDVVRAVAVGEIPNPPATVDVLFIGVAPTAEDAPDAGGHFYTSPGDRLRRGLFALLSEPVFGLPLTGLGLRESVDEFHKAGCFFVHAAKVRPRVRPAPPKEAIEYCARRHLREEIRLIGPRAVCFLGKNNASAAAFALFGRRIGGEPTPVDLDEWSGVAVVASQPIRGWSAAARDSLIGLWRECRSERGVTADRTPRVSQPAADGVVDEAP